MSLLSLSGFDGSETPRRHRQNAKGFAEFCAAAERGKALSLLVLPVAVLRYAQAVQYGPEAGQSSAGAARRHGEENRSGVLVVPMKCG